MTRLARFAMVSFAALMIGGCAALPDDAPVFEQLDAETGATITRLGHPVELYRETPVLDATGRFAFFAPFETNQMGTRDLYLWIAVPIDSPPDATPPSVTVNGNALTLAPPGRAADFAGLKHSPYKLPTPWSSSYYYKIDAAIIGLLGDARDVGIAVSEVTKEGTVRTPFATRLGAASPIKEFATRQ
jgi:hypothetical protein